MATGQRDDPYRGFNFKVEITGPDGTIEAGFREVGGLTFNTDPVEYREGNYVNNSVIKLTGLGKFANVTGKKGFTKDQRFYLWYQNILRGINDRREGAIILLDEQRNPVLRWNFEGGWICKWEGPAMNATSNDVAIESIEICVERVELADRV